MNSLYWGLPVSECSTQNQALNALFFLYRKVLNLEVSEVNAIRANSRSLTFRVLATPAIISSSVMGRVHPPDTLVPELPLPVEGGATPGFKGGVCVEFGAPGFKGGICVEFGVPGFKGGVCVEFGAPGGMPAGVVCVEFGVPVGMLVGGGVRVGVEDCDPGAGTGVEAPHKSPKSSNLPLLLLIKQIMSGSFGIGTAEAGPAAKAMRRSGAIRIVLRGASFPYYSHLGPIANSATQISIMNTAHPLEKGCGALWGEEITVKTEEINVTIVFCLKALQNKILRVFSHQFLKKTLPKNYVSFR